MSHDAENKRQQEMMSMLAGGSDAFSQLSPLPGGVEQVLALAAAADPLFFNQPPGSPFPAGKNSQFIAVGDFNGDGKLDIAAANRGDVTVSILLNKGDGTFQPKVDYTVGSGPCGIVVGDFNGDGKLDIAVANSGDNTVSILLGNGDGTFQPKVDYTVGVTPFDITVGDFNGDGKLDIATANAFNNNVSVLLNTTAPGSATASFTRQDFAVGTIPTLVAVGDFNGDGKLDIAVANDGANNVMVLLQSPLVVNVETIQATQNVPFSGPIAVITGASGMPTVTINWGDNASSPGTVSQNLDGSFTVSGTGPHTYSSLGTFPLTVTATESIFSSQDVGQAIVQVPLAVQVNTIQASANVQFNGPVATISGATMAGDTTATINWGDGTPATQGTISGSGNTLTVSGGHMYAQGGTFTLTVSAAEGTRSAQSSGQAIVHPALAVEVDTIQTTATVPFSGAVAIISGANSASDTTATIIWGDNTTTPGTVVANPDGTLTVSGNHCIVFRL